jgi:hypothetical protein
MLLLRSSPYFTKLPISFPSFVGKDSKLLRRAFLFVLLTSLCTLAVEG